VLQALQRALLFSSSSSSSISVLQFYETEKQTDLVQLEQIRSSQKVNRCSEM